MLQEYDTNIREEEVVAGFKMKLTVPIVNVDWWAKDKNKMLKLVEDYNKQNWGAQTTPG